MSEVKKPLSIIKIGGKLVGDEDRLEKFLQRFADLEGYKILVHGGGKAASEWSRKLGLMPKMVDGRRVTDEATLEVVTMVYAGLYNKKITSFLQAINCDALGLTGSDMNLIQSHKRIVSKVDYGFAGDVDFVNKTRLQQLLEINITPVFCAITHDKKGQLLNTNADTIASELAVAMAPFYSVTLKFCFEKNGVLQNPESDDSTIKEMDRVDYEMFKNLGVITDGMIPKIDNAFYALEHQVDQVFICGVEAIELNAEVKGTSIFL